MGITALALLLSLAAAGAGAAGMGINKSGASGHNSAMEQWLRSNYPNLTDDQIKALIDQYGDQASNNIFDVGTWGDQSDWAGLQKLMQDIQDAHAKYGDMPIAPSESDLNRIQQEAYNEIDSENQRILDLYNQTFQNSENVLNRELMNNAQMFGDYRNQLLTNEAMRQQALAGSTRFELDRQQRNAITRGASAAQRLVANINTQLGLQAQSAQQALDTSNALAQNLLAHRQAQQGVRNAYLQAQNQYNQNVASNLSGQAERRFNYGQGRKQGAVNDYNYAYDRWNENITNSGLGSVGQGIYRSMYGDSNNRRNANKGI